MRVASTVSSCLLAMLLAACATEDPQAEAAPQVPEPPAEELEFLEETVTVLGQDEDGAVQVALGPMARLFVIHPDYSPDAPGLASYARAAQGTGRKVFVTVWVREYRPKAPPVTEGDPYPFVIVRMGNAKDPRDADEGR